MVHRYEVDGTLEGDRVIRLNEPLPCKEGPVKVVVTPHPEEAEFDERNRAALKALDQLLIERDDLTPEEWAELENLIRAHPLRVRKSSLA